MHHLHSNSSQFIKSYKQLESNMLFKIVSALAFATFVAAQDSDTDSTGANGPSGPTILPPFPGNPLPVVRGSDCDGGRLVCCSSGQVPTTPVASGVLSRLGISTGSVGGLVGLGCSPTTVASGCSSTPLCCTQTGSVGIGCNTVNMSL